jgi:hypothetical protein
LSRDGRDGSPSISRSNVASIVPSPPGIATIEVARALTSVPGVNSAWSASEVMSLPKSVASAVRSQIGSPSASRSMPGTKRTASLTSYITTRASGRAPSVSAGFRPTTSELTLRRNVRRVSTMSKPASLRRASRTPSGQ